MRNLTQYRIEKNTDHLMQNIAYMYSNDTQDQSLETCDMPEFTEQGVFHMDTDFTSQNSWLAV